MPRKRADRIDPRGLEKIDWRRPSKHPPSRAHYVQEDGTLTLCKAFDTKNSPYLKDPNHRLIRNWTGPVTCLSCLRIVKPEYAT